MDRNFRSDQPIYLQLIAQLEQDIASGALPPGARLPSVRELAASLAVNPNTVQRALQELERSGLVYTQRTNGRFVTDDRAAVDACRRSLAKEKTDAYLAAMRLLGYDRQDMIALLRNQEKEDET